MSWRKEIQQEILRQQMGGPTAESDQSFTDGGGLGRRDFLKVTGGLVIFVALGPTGTSPASAQRRRRGYPDDFNAYLRIGEDGRVTVFSGKIIEIAFYLMTASIAVVYIFLFSIYYFLFCDII